MFSKLIAAFTVAIAASSVIAAPENLLEARQSSCIPCVLDNTVDAFEVVYGPYPNRFPCPGSTMTCTGPYTEVTQGLAETIGTITTIGVSK